MPERIIFCESCGFGMAKAMPSTEVLDKYYHNSNYWGKTEPVISHRRQPILAALARCRWNLIQSHLKEYRSKHSGLKLLDVGSGFGYLGIVAANSPGVVLNEYVAVEPDPNVRSALEFAWSKFGNDSRLATFSGLREVEGEYDIIALSHVLEHVQDPFRLVNDALSFASSGGLLLIDVPNRDDLFEPDVFPHLLFFSPQSIERLLGRLDLQILELDSWGAPREMSPLSRAAPSVVRARSKLLAWVTGLLPARFSMFLLAKHFQISDRHERGTWVRVIAQMKGKT